MVTYPCREFGLGDVAGCDGKHGDRRLGLVGLESPTVQEQEETDGEEGCALVAVDEWMVLRQAKSIGRGEVGEIRFSIYRKMLGARERGVEQALIPYASAASVLCKALAM